MPRPAALNLVLLAALALFLADPRLDVLVSDQFFRPGQGFWLAALPGFRDLREVLRSSGNATGLVAGALFLASLAIGPARNVPARIWGYCFATMALGPGIAVNLVLKPLWGRARPANVTLFGGSHSFTPVYEPANQCSWGCSFVSGEAAAAVGVAIVLGVLLWPMLKPRGRVLLTILLALYAALTAGLRVAMGRHFLSDVIFGGLVSAYTGWALYHALRIAEAQPQLTPAAIAADARALARRIARR
jgi:membrane-associated phospholipid phosphatase